MGQVRVHQRGLNFGLQVWKLGSGLLNHAAYFSGFDGVDIAHLLLKTLQEMRGQQVPTLQQPE